MRALLFLLALFSIHGVLLFFPSTVLNRVLEIKITVCCCSCVSCYLPHSSLFLFLCSESRFGCLYFLYCWIIRDSFGFFFLFIVSLPPTLLPSASVSPSVPRCWEGPRSRRASLVSHSRGLACLSRLLSSRRVGC